VKFTREDIAANYVRGISDQGLKFGNEWLTGTIAITDGGIVTQWTDKPFADLLVEDFQLLLDTNPEIVVIGTGAVSELTPRELMFGFARQGTGLEVMDSHAAARTYNVLLGEGRRVVAVFYSV
jgi:uncharacterized protein